MIKINGIRLEENGKYNTLKYQNLSFNIGKNLIIEQEKNSNITHIIDISNNIEYKLTDNEKTPYTRREIKLSIYFND